MSGTRPINAALLAQIRSRPGFVAFAALLNERVRLGNTLDVQLMLQEIGAPGDVAHEIIEGWPGRKAADVRLQTVMTPLDVYACWLACHIDDIARYDWPNLLARTGTMLLERKKVRDRAAENGDASAQDQTAPTSKR